MTRTLRCWLLIGGLGACCACSRRTPGQAHRDAIEAQQKAEAALESARREAQDKIAQAEQARDRAIGEARQKAAEAQAKANKSIREANRVMQGTADTVGGWAQEELDDVDNLIDAARAKAQGATPEARAKFNEAMRDVEQQRDALHDELGALEQRAGAELDQAKARFHERVEQIKRRVRAARQSL